MIAYLDNAERVRVDANPLVRAARAHEQRCLYAGQPVADIHASLPPTLIKAKSGDASARRE